MLVSSLYPKEQIANSRPQRNSVGTSVEHHSLYQYQLVNTRDIFIGQIQTETAYYQPNPYAGLPFPPSTDLNDPQLSSLCNNRTGQCSGWGLRIVDSQDIGIYGAGLYSYFSNYNNCMYFLCFVTGV